MPQRNRRSKSDSPAAEPARSPKPATAGHAAPPKAKGHSVASCNIPTEREWLIGGDETANLIRTMDWSGTPLGPRDAWPQSLRTIVNLILASRFPMAVLWGSELISIYNDGYRVIAADKHPGAMARSTRDIWPEVWEFNKPILDTVMTQGQTVHLEDQLFHIDRRGHLEDAHFTLCYSPIYTEEGRIGGTLVTLLETTQRVSGERQLKEATERLEAEVAARDRVQEDLHGNQVELAVELEAMTRLHALGMRSVQEGTLRTTLSDVVDVAIAITGADFGNIQLLDEESAELVIAAQRGFPDWWIKFWNTVSKGQGVCGTALERGERVIVEDVEHSPIFLGTPALEIQLKAGVRAVQSTPLVSRSGRVLGMFSTHYRTPRRPDDRALRLLDLLARQAAEMIEHARTEQALHESEAHYRALFENMSAGFVLFEVVQNDDGIPVDLVILAANKGFEATTGLTAAEIAGKRLTQALPGIENDAEDWIATYGKVALTGKSRSFERYSELLRTFYFVSAYQAAPRQCAVTFQDITARKRAEDSLHDSEERFDLAFRAAQEGIWDWNMETDAVYYSAQYKRMLGYGDEELEPHVSAWKRLLHPDDKAMALSVVEAVMQGERTYEMEFRVRHKDGHYVPVLSRGFPVRRSENGPIVRIVGTHFDLTDHKRDETALRDSEERYHGLFSSMQEGFALHELICDKQGRPKDYRYLDVNPAFEQMTGIPRSRWIGHTVREVLPDVEEYWIELFGKVVATGVPTHYENYVRELDRYYDVTAYRPKPGQFAVIAMEVTERKRVEELLRQSQKLLRETEEVGKVGGWEIDIDTMKLTWTEEVYRIHEVEPDYAPVVDTAVAFYAPESRPVIEQAVRRAIESGEPFDAELPLITAKGNRRWVHAIGQTDSEHRRVYGFFQDITERKRAEEELARHRDHLEELIEQRTQEAEAAREQVRQADRLASLGTFAAGIAHEINNPLGMMLLGTETALANIAKTEAVVGFLNQNKDLILRCAHIVRGVLDFSRKQSADKTPVNLNDAAGHAIVFTRESCTKHRVTVQTHLASALNPILGNMVELTQVVVNLVQNAVQACTQGGHVMIETCNANDKVRLVVRDDGCGMNPGQVRRVFDPFFTTRLEKGGTGLGLSVVHGIVTDHRGTITVTSEEGKGTTFTIEFGGHDATHRGDGQGTSG